MGLMHHQQTAIDINQYVPAQQTTSVAPYVQGQAMNNQQSSSAPANPPQNFR